MTEVRRLTRARACRARKLLSGPSSPSQAFVDPVELKMKKQQDVTVRLPAPSPSPSSRARAHGARPAHVKPPDAPSLDPLGAAPPPRLTHAGSAPGRPIVGGRRLDPCARRRPAERGAAARSFFRSRRSLLQLARDILTGSPSLIPTTLRNRARRSRASSSRTRRQEAVRRARRRCALFLCLARSPSCVSRPGLSRLASWTLAGSQDGA